MPEHWLETCGGFGERDPSLSKVGGRETRLSYGINVTVCIIEALLEQPGIPHTSAN